jgi:hypothetical protein
VEEEEEDDDDDEWRPKAFQMLRDGREIVGSNRRLIVVIVYRSKLR